MDKKFGIIMIFLGGLLMIALIIFLVFSLLRNETEQDSFLNQPIDGNQIPVVDKTNEVKKIESEPAKVVKPAVFSITSVSSEEQDLERIAKSFSERFGSFSNQSNFTNILDLKMYMSAKMMSWADNYVEQNKKSNVFKQEYYGMTTRAMSSELIEFDEAGREAKIMVQTRRMESVSTGEGAGKLFNQNILITFVKEAGDWKVDSAYWQ